MSVNTVAHLNFHGEASEALNFYQSVFGGEVQIATYGDFGMPKDQPDAEKVVFGQIVAPNGFRVMAYDVPGAAAPQGPAPTTRRAHGTTITTEKFFLSVRGETAEEVGALWETLSAGATIVEPYGPAQWAPAFGMLTDRFGVTWILDVAASY
ncbi:VOC family protein [Cryptosporangium sp. NPDC051539]|uniref:VOC family protein n=1 Tax=Cryptosporangium sp. NPDC051539 TaxID=3363962 RepID=UPI0037AAC230